VESLNKYQAPNNKKQTITKFQAPMIQTLKNLKQQSFEFWSLGFICNLVLEIWDLKYHSGTH
jgi:SET domain-containing protein